MATDQNMTNRAHELLAVLAQAELWRTAVNELYNETLAELRDVNEQIISA